LPAAYAASADLAQQRAEQIISTAESILELEAAMASLQAGRSIVDVMNGDYEFMLQAKHR
jgi:hypothetical protein